jgi:curved DNA-binding protein CbpA
MLPPRHAWKVLSDSSKRAVYDAARASAAASTRRRWESVRDEAATSASAAAQRHGHTWEQFVAWVETAAAEADKVPARRGSGGAVVGSILAAIAGCVVGPWIGLDVVPGMLVGIVAGAAGGFFAARVRPPTSGAAATG